MLFSYGSIIAILSVLFITSFFKFIRNNLLKSKNIKHYIPSGFILSMIVGIIVIFLFTKFKILSSFNDNFWGFLQSWLIIVSLAGYGKIAGVKLIYFVKGILGDKSTYISQIENELKDLKNKMKRLQEKKVFFENKK